MATRSQGTSGINNFDVNWFQSVINNLRGNFVANGYITAYEMNTLIYLWNVFNDHSHNVRDLWGIWNYGDGVGNGYSVFAGYYRLDYAYRSTTSWGSTYDYETGSFYGSVDSCYAQYNALPNPKSVGYDDGYGNISYTDYYKAITGGPSPVYGTAYYNGGAGDYNDKGLYGPSNLIGDIGGVSAGDIVYASKQNELANALGAGANHYHGWDDRTGP